MEGVIYRRKTRPSRHSSKGNPLRHIHGASGSCSRNGSLLLALENLTLSDEKQLNHSKRKPTSQRTLQSACSPQIKDDPANRVRKARTLRRPESTVRRQESHDQDLARSLPLSSRTVNHATAAGQTHFVSCVAHPARTHREKTAGKSEDRKRISCKPRMKRPSGKARVI